MDKNFVVCEINLDNGNVKFETFGLSDYRDSEKMLSMYEDMWNESCDDINIDYVFYVYGHTENGVDVYDYLYWLSGVNGESEYSKTVLTCQNGFFTLHNM